MDLDHRKVPINIAKLVAEALQDLCNDGLRCRAVRTLVVAIFDHRHGRVVVTQDVVTRRYGYS